jgi:molybdopterin molybdotransferase
VLHGVRVRPVWRVAVLSTGDELVPAGRIPGPAQIVDCNGPALAAAAIAAGAEVVHLGRLPDVPDVLIGALDALPACDLIVTSGGVSMGAYDVVKAARPRPGTAGVASRPGCLPVARVGPQAAVPARPPGRNDRPRGRRTGFQSA